MTAQDKSEVEVRAVTSADISVFSNASSIIKVKSKLTFVHFHSFGKLSQFWADTKFQQEQLRQITSCLIKLSNSVTWQSCVRKVSLEVNHHCHWVKITERKQLFTGW